MWQVDAATAPATTRQRQTTGTSTAKPSVPPEPPTYLLVLTRIDVVMLTVYRPLQRLTKRCLLLAESVITITARGVRVCTRTWGVRASTRPRVLGIKVYMRPRAQGHRVLRLRGTHSTRPRPRARKRPLRTSTGIKNRYSWTGRGRRRYEEVELRYEEGSKPFQPARYSVPHHYQERLATHLRKLEAKGAVEHVADPTQGGEQGQGNHRPPEEEAGQVKLYGLPSRRGGPKAPVPQRGGAEGQVHEEDQPAWGLLRYLFFPRSYSFLSIMAILASAKPVCRLE